MRKAFTLLELMTVVGIMAFLGLAAANGYNALKRGMADRSAVEVANAFLKAAKERALVDRVPTVVHCWNRCVREATDDENAIVVGEAVAVRRSGRITRVADKLLFDEFGDLNRSYDADNDDGDLGNRKGFRLWHMRDNGSAEMEYSIVADGVYRGYSVGTSYSSWCGEVSSDAILQDIPQGNENMKVYGCAFYKLDNAKFSNWLVGSAYGLEFQRLRLTDGFVFDGDIPTSIGEIKKAAAILFNPEEIDYTRDEGVDIMCCRVGTDGSQEVDHKAGRASSREQTK